MELSSSSALPPVALVAADDGPRSTLEPLAGHWKLSLPSLEHDEVTLEAYWRDAFARANVRLLVVGTSNSGRGRIIETAARHAATRSGLPVAAIEDYPGNYFDFADSPTRLLVVESAFSERLYRSRAEPQPPMVIIPPARYDRWRGKTVAGRSPRPPYTVLWAGQPETACCIATLEWLLGELAGLPARLLFRPHPRDPGAGTGVYEALLAGAEWTDVSMEPVAATLARDLDLVVTQFSSVAVEAGFAGVPSLHVLLPNAGGKLLQQLKGYAVPAICDAGAAFLAVGGAGDATVREALLDSAARERVLVNFRALYGADTPTARLVAEALRGIIL